MGKSLALDESVGTALACEHARNVATVAWLRSAGVTFFLLVSLLGAWQGWAGWAEYVMPLSLYWLTALLVWRVSRLPHPAVRWLVRTVPFIDFFLAYWAQNESLPSSASASGVAGFTVGIFALQLMIASWAVKGSWLWLTGAWAMLLEVRLQSAAGVAVPAMIAACMLLLLTVIVCQTSQRWKRALIRRAIDEVREREMLSSRMMRSERHACAGAHAAGLARELSDRILGALAQSNFVLDHWEGNDSEEGRQRAMRACRDHLVAMSELTRLLDKLNEVPTYPFSGSRADGSATGCYSFA